MKNFKLTKNTNNGITLIALVITIVVSCDKLKKYSNINRFLFLINSKYIVKNIKTTLFSSVVYFWLKNNLAKMPKNEKKIIQSKTYKLHKIESHSLYKMSIEKTYHKRYNKDRDEGKVNTFNLIF